MDNLNNFQTHLDIDKLRDAVYDDSVSNQGIMPILHPLRYTRIGNDILNKIINRFKNSVKYDTPNKWFETSKFHTFMSYFTRRLSERKHKEIDNDVQGYALVTPCECDIESLGDFSDTSSILRMKKPTDAVMEDLQKLGIEVPDLSFVNMKLRKCYYHRVHSPVNGRIVRTIPIGAQAPLFGDNSLWLVDMDTDFGNVYLLLEIGHFEWGSQIIMMYERGNFDAEMLIHEGNKYFVGDGIFRKVVQGAGTLTADAVPVTFSRNYSEFTPGASDTGAPGGM